MVWVCFYLLYRVLAGPFQSGNTFQLCETFRNYFINSFLFFSSCLYGASIKWMIHLGSDLLIFLSSFLIVQVFVLLFTFWGFFQLYHPSPSTEFTISTEALLVSKQPFHCPHSALV